MPTNLFFKLLFRNHETRQMTQAFQFKLECEKKYSSKALYQACMHAFDALPVCGLVDSRFLCMHGGISPDIRTLSDIEKLDRFKETPYSGPLCDLLWCDPSEDFDEIKDDQPDFKPNDVRGCAYFFSYYACRDFLLRNNLLSIIRGHEVQKDGVRFFRKSSRTKFPVVISLFSAPNYCDTYNNVAAILKLDANQQLSVVHIEAHAHPFVLPNYENG
jgi:serine/threonine-protein phosphatase 2B catalytic subunit